MININWKQWDQITKEDIEILLASDDENFFFEYKNEDVSTKKLIKEISAFANTYGGYIIIGIDDDKNAMAELFDTTKQNISLHIKNIFEENELNENSVVKENLTTASDGKNYKTKFYNLDLIISVGYRVKSIRGTQFRIWANKLIKEYLIKGYNLNVDRFKNNGGGVYFEEVLEKIRDIRSSEKVFWRKILDIYATSVDYDAKDEKTKEFFKTVQDRKSVV